MRIVLVGNGYLPIPPPAWGAIEILIWDLFNYMKNLGHDVLIVNTRNESDVILEIIKFNPDVIHVHAPRFYNILNSINCKAKIASSQDTQETSDVFKGFVNGRFYILTVSDELKKKYIDNGRDSSTIYVTPNGIDSNLFQYNDFCIYPGRSIYLGMIEERKKQYKYQGINSIYFAGRCCCSKFNTRNPRYMGEWTKDMVYSFMTCFANLVMLSSAEAHCLAVSEALICGLGVVISEATSANLDTSKPWITVIPNDKLDDIEYVEEQIRINRKISIIHRSEIRKHALETISWNTRINNYINAYEDILRKKSSSETPSF